MCQSSSRNTEEILVVNCTLKAQLITSIPHKSGIFARENQYQRGRPIKQKHENQEYRGKLAKEWNTASGLLKVTGKHWKSTNWNEIDVKTSSKIPDTRVTTVPADVLKEGNPDDSDDRRQ